MKRSTELDVVRAFSIILVLFTHLPNFSVEPSNWLIWLRRGGFSGVDLFFVLSGFLVGGLLLSEYKKSGKVDIKRFLIRRGMKIYPAFWFILLVSILLPITADRPTWANIWPELFYLQAYQQGLMYISWSLSVEEHFYLLLALLIWLLVKRGGSDPFRLISRIALSLGIVCLVMRVATIILIPRFNFWIHYTPTHLRIDSLAFGVMIAYFHYYHPERFCMFASRFRWPLLVFGVIFLLPAFTFGLYSTRMLSYGFTLLYLGASMIITAMTAIKLPRAAAWLGKIGKYSYSIYLWHQPVQFLLSEHFETLDPGLGYPVYFFLSIAIGIATSELIEIPVLRIRDQMFPNSGRHFEQKRTIPQVISN